MATQCNASLSTAVVAAVSVKEETERVRILTIYLTSFDLDSTDLISLRSDPVSVFISSQDIG